MTKEEIGAILKELRTRVGLTQKEVARKIGRTQQIVGHWETGYSQPDANTLFALCAIYGTSVDHAFGFASEDQICPEERLLLDKYRTLDNHGKDMVDTVLSKEHDRCATSIYQVREETAKYGTIKLPLPDNRASAGAGDEFLSDASRQIYVLANRLTIRADFVVSVDGHSMEPLYYDGDLVLIHQQPAVDIGAIGLYAVEDKGYIKKQGPDRLISINPEYPDIVPEEYQECRCFGEVIGKVEPEWIVEG